MVKPDALGNVYLQVAELPEGGADAIGDDDLVNVAVIAHLRGVKEETIYSELTRSRAEREQAIQAGDPEPTGLVPEPEPAKVGRYLVWKFGKWRNWQRPSSTWNRAGQLHATKAGLAWLRSDAASEEWITQEQIAMILDRKPGTVYRMLVPLRAGATPKIPSEKPFGRTLLVRKTVLLELLGVDQDDAEAPAKGRKPRAAKSGKPPTPAFSAPTE